MTSIKGSELYVTLKFYQMSENIIEKAKYQEGDIHPNGQWIYKMTKSGKLDWRSIPKDHPMHPDNVGGKKPAQTAPTVSKKPAVAAPVTGKRQKLEVWAKKAKDDTLVQFVSNPKNDFDLRDVSYVELESRGYDVSNLNTAGTLEDGWNKQKKVQKLFTDDNEEPPVADTSDSDSDVTPDKWYMNPNHPKIKAKFDLSTATGRVAYDQFKDKEKRKDPKYKSAAKLVSSLNRSMYFFFDNPGIRFLISAGGGGVGKSWAFKDLANDFNQKPFDSVNQEPGAADYDYVELGNVRSEKQLLEVLRAHNGKILLFDDTDQLLKDVRMASVMKKATATTGERILEDPDNRKKNFVFTGRIVVLTNKSFSDLAVNEDAKAILSRVTLPSQIYLTVPETIEVLKTRFQDINFESVPRLEDPDEDKKERDEVLQFIEENVMRIDPKDFTTRTFEHIIVQKRLTESTNKAAKASLFAKKLGAYEDDWRDEALNILMKAEEDEGEDYIEKADILDLSDEEMTIEKAESLLFDDDE